MASMELANLPAPSPTRATPTGGVGPQDVQLKMPGLDGTPGSTAGRVPTVPTTSPLPLGTKQQMAADHKPPESFRAASSAETTPQGMVLPAIATSASPSSGQGPSELMRQAQAAGDAIIAAAAASASQSLLEQQALEVKSGSVTTAKPQLKDVRLCLDFEVGGGHRACLCLSSLHRYSLVV